LRAGRADPVGLMGEKGEMPRSRQRSAVVVMMFLVIFYLNRPASKKPVKTGALPSESVYRASATSIDGELIPLSRYAGKVSLIVNVASQ